MAKYGTFGAKKIYMPEDVREFLNYANQRGIKVIPELDAPAHAGMLIACQNNSTSFYLTQNIFTNEIGQEMVGSLVK